MCEAGLPKGINEMEALIVLIVNILAPGIGTLISACIGDCASTTVLVGIAQILTAPFLVGWIWAICWGIKLLDAAKKGETMQGDREAGAPAPPSAEGNPNVDAPPPVAQP